MNFFFCYSVQLYKLKEKIVWFLLLFSIHCVWSLKYFGHCWGNEHKINFIFYTLRADEISDLDEREKIKQIFVYDLLMIFVCLVHRRAKKYNNDLRCYFTITALLAWCVCVFSFSETSTTMTEVSENPWCSNVKHMQTLFASSPLKMSVCVCDAQKYVNM